MADQIVVTDAHQLRSLLTNHFDAAKIKRIEMGIGSRPSQSAKAKAAARQALAAVNSDLLTDTDSIVLLSTARMTRDGGVFTLVEAARLLMAKYPNLRIWFVGDGPARDKIYSLLRSEGIRAQIAMPGSFCHTDDLMMAADVYVHSGNDSSDSLLSFAVASGLPIVARRSVSNFSMFNGSELAGSGLAGSSNEGCPEVAWYQGDKEYDLRKKIKVLLNDRAGALRAAEALKRRLLQTRPESRMLDLYGEMIRRVVDRDLSCHQHSAQGLPATAANRSNANQEATG
jgi:glycosyltransferase involved in cell wall biosynthesis